MKTDFEKRTHQVSFRIKESEFQTVELVAKREKTTCNAILYAMVEEMIDREDRKLRRAE